MNVNQRKLYFLGSQQEDNRLEKLTSFYRCFSLHKTMTLKAHAAILKKGRD